MIECEHDDALPLGSVIGIIGGGQLGRMLALAAARLGFNCHIYCPEQNSPAFAVAAKHWCAEFDDKTALTEFAQSCAVITYEFENIPLEAVQILQEITPVLPNINALNITQDRLHERAFLTTQSIPIAPFMKVDNTSDLSLAIERLGDNTILKNRRFGYDGKGQTAFSSSDIDTEEALNQTGNQPAILEQKINFEREISVLIIRSNNELENYDLCENLHLNQMLRRTRVPAKIDEDIEAQAILMAQEISIALDYVGVMAVEMFYCPENSDEPLIVNEIAPRVHNSGHWTQDGCIIDQFENHIRAIAGWPLGSTRRHSDIVMTNLIGEDILNWSEYAGNTDNCLHIYGKKEPRDGRKMGHMTTLSPLSNPKPAPLKEGEQNEDNVYPIRPSS